VGGHALVEDGGQQLLQLPTVGQPQLGIELEQRLEHEAPGGDLGVRQGEALGAVLEIAEQQEVDVDRPRAVAHAPGGSAQRELDLLAGVEQLLGAELGLHRQARVEEVALVWDLALGGGLVYARGLDGQNATLGEGCARGPQVREPVALVRPQAEVAPQTSFQTSTDTSSTGSGIGGSGLAAFTRTDSAPKRSIRRSATALQRRSSVL
jgi:hypothetical protein